MNLTGAIEILKLHKHTTDKFRHSIGDKYVSDAIDTVVEWAEKPLPTDVQKEAWNNALKEVEALMRKPCWDLTLCEDIKKLKK